MSVLQYATYYVPLVVIIKCIYKKTFNKQVAPELFLLFKVTFAIIFVATIFFFLDISNKVLFYRILFMSLIPLSIIIAELYRKRIISRRAFNSLIILGLAYQAARDS